jgi:hypothetical protein
MAAVCAADRRQAPELRKRRTLMTVTVAFTIALPVIFSGIREIYHLNDPARYAPAGAPDAFATVGTLLAEFGFIAAAAVGATAGTVPVVLLTVWQIIITPALVDHVLPHLINAQRLCVGVAMDQLKPAVLAGGPLIGPTGGIGLAPPPMPTWAMATVIAGWLAIGAWKMATRDA